MFPLKVVIALLRLLEWDMERGKKPGEEENYDLPVQTLYLRYGTYRIVNKPVQLAVDEVEWRLAAIEKLGRASAIAVGREVSRRGRM